MNRSWTLCVAVCFVSSAIAMQLPNEAISQPFPDQFADIDDTVRFVPSTQPTRPEAQRPPLSTEKNVDTGREPSAWQRITDDWGGARPKLDDRGIAINAGLYADWFQNVRGGANTADLDFVHLAQLNITLDTERLFGHAGGTGFVNLQHIGGDDPSENVGDWQAVSSLAADRRDQLAEIWFEQRLFNDQFRLKLGKIDAGGEFDVSDVAGAFLNASGGMSPTLPGFATYPDPSFGAVVEYRPSDRFSIRGGVFDGAGQEGKTLGDDGARTLFGAPADLLFVAELGTTWTANSLPGRASIGMTWHTGMFDRFDGGTDDGVAGYYLVIEQGFYKEDPDNDEDLQGTSLYLRGGWTDGDTQDVCYHVGGGVVCTGWFEGRDDDQTGVAINVVGFSDASGAGFDGDELNIELFHKFQLAKYFSVQPDVQYVVNPGGDEDLDDAVAIGVRFALEF